MRTDEVIDKIITILKSHLPATLDGIDATLEDVRDGTSGTEDCYYFGDAVELPSVFPAMSIRVRSEDYTNPDQDSIVPLINMGIELEFVMTGDYEQTINRDILKYAQAIKEIIFQHKTLDNTVGSCEIVSALYSNLWQRMNGGNLYKAFLIEIRVLRV